ncbi:acyl-CoA dehydrogenase family protein [Yinghuangia sp. YIM S09857]|uniref:acyl-CoA dehydrogenase family protein n=1 Tax=Yinghuangia sp. YIM S09857 TaxID=3436929 RepID=UPI003F53E3C1
MNFTLDDDQQAVADAARAFFAAQGDLALIRRLLDDPGSGTAAPGRKALASVGFLGITVAESSGGGGGTLLDLAVVAEQAGHYLASPSLATSARAAVLLAGNREQLSALSDGSTAFAVVDGDPQASEPSLDAATAEMFLAFDGEDLVMGPGSAAPVPPLDVSRSLAEVRLTDSEVLVPAARHLWERARQVGAVVLAAEDLGAASQVLDFTLEYVRMRTAFDRPVGSFQAVKHALVDVYTDLEQVRSLVWWAAWAADADPGELPLASSAAAALAAGAFERATETAIQVHGGIGFTWEHDAHLYWRRAKVDRLLLGDESEHLDAVARHALAGADHE